MNQITNFHQIIAWFFSKKSLHLDTEGPWVVEMIAKVIIDLYSSLPDSNHLTTKKIIEIKQINKNDYPSEDENFLKPIFDLEEYVKKELDKFLIDFLIHGSFASIDYSKGWSDLDTYLIISDKTFEDLDKIIFLREKIIYASNYLYKIDPLQHHGFIFATEYDTKNYLSHCLPIEVLKKSKSLLGESKHTIYEHRSTENTRDFLKRKNIFFKNCYEEGAMIHHGLDKVFLLENYAEINAMYQMKYFLSVLMSMPAFFLDAMGKPIYKDESFAVTKPYFGDEWEIIESASAIRYKWQFQEVHPYDGNHIPNWLINDLGRDYFKRAYNLTNLMSEYFD